MVSQVTATVATGSNGIDYIYRVRIQRSMAVISSQSELEQKLRMRVITNGCQLRRETEVEVYSPRKSKTGNLCTLGPF